MDLCTVVVCNMTFLNTESNICVSMTHYIDNKHAFLLMFETIKYHTGYSLFSMTIVFILMLLIQCPTHYKRSCACFLVLNICKYHLPSNRDHFQLFQNENELLSSHVFPVAKAKYGSANARFGFWANAK